MIKISIIIPVYNVEKYIERCLQSCLEQDLEVSDYEIIVVNDGSPDNSLEIANNFAREHSNIKILDQQNYGLSVARNEGLKIAQGKYIWFVDSDDWIKTNCILELYNLCNDNNLDVLLFDAWDVENDIYKKRNSIKSNTNQIEIGINYLDYYNIVFPVCFKIFKRNFLTSNSIYFLQNIYHEDNEFTPRMFYYANRVLSIKKSLYYVNTNPNSITRSVNSKKAYDLILICRSYLAFLEDNKIGNGIQIHFFNLMGLLINSSLFEIFKLNKIERNKYYYFLKSNQNLFDYLKKSNILKYRIEAYFFIVSSYLFFKFYAIAFILKKVYKKFSR